MSRPIIAGNAQEQDKTSNYKRQVPSVGGGETNEAMATILAQRQAQMVEQRHAQTVEQDQSQTVGRPQVPSHSDTVLSRLDARMSSTTDADSEGLSLNNYGGSTLDSTSTSNNSNTSSTSSTSSTSNTPGAAGAGQCTSIIQGEIVQGDPEVFIYGPSRFSREIQRGIRNKNRWHIPSIDRSVWLCFSLDQCSEDGDIATSSSAMTSMVDVNGACLSLPLPIPSTSLPLPSIQSRSE